MLKCLRFICSFNFNINLKSKSVNISKYEKLILNLPNITPNGVIVPKKEIIQEYTNIQNYLIKIIGTKIAISKVFMRYFMIEYWLKVYEFCTQEPLWAIAFFFCGFVIGDVYFTL